MSDGSNCESSDLELKMERIAEKLGFSLGDVQKFLRETAWNDYHCEVCQHDVFSLSSHEGHPLPFSLNIPGSLGSGYWAMAAECKKCGNVKLLSTTFVKKWLEGQRDDS